MSGTIENVHFIAIGGNVMHDLAIALSQKGIKVTGSDVEIDEHKKSTLSKAGIQTPQLGWFPEKITKDVNEIIIGFDQEAENPEIVKAKALGIPMYSYPEYIYKHSKDKHRIVIAGSHGKTSITAIILHVLNFANREFDYLIETPLEEFETTIRLTDAPLIIIEGDECPAISNETQPKFLHYKHHIGLVTGIAWDHIDIYPTFEDYVNQFDTFADATPKGGMLIYSEADDLASLICGKEREAVQPIEYSAHKNEIVNEHTYLINGDQKIPVMIFGKHNMKNISGAKTVCSKIGISDKIFYEAIQSFKGPSSRLELLGKNEHTSIYKDYAYSPLKLKASTNAVKKQFGGRKLAAVLELHTLSSLHKDFLSQYYDTFKAADEPIIYFNPKTIKQNHLGNISSDEIIEAFNNSKLKVFTDSKELKNYLLGNDWDKKNLLFMSSGNFDGLALKEITNEILQKIKQPNS